MATLKEPFALDRSLNTTEVTPRNIADVLAEGLSHITGRTASEVEYDNTDSGLTSDDVQGAIDELSERPTLPSVDIQTAVDEFETYNGGLLSECKVALSPNQDLHGYAEPWVGGAGKNKVPLTLNNLKAINTNGTWSGNDYTYRGVTYTVLTDDADNVLGIKANGQATQNSPFILWVVPIFSGTCILSGCPANGSVNTYHLQYSNYVNYTYEQIGTDVSVTQFDAETYPNARMQIIVNNNYTANDLIFTPMLRATGESADFAPYSNICPISGHTQVEVENEGKNKLSGLEQGSLDTYGGTNPSTTRIRTKEFIKVDSATAYTFSSESSIQIYMLEFDEIGNERINSPSWVDLPVTFTTQPTTKYFKAMFRYSNNADIIPSDAKNCQLEKGSTATAYEPYNGYQVTVNLGGTYYSGTLDMVSGVFVPDTASVDLGTLTWTYEALWGVGSDFYAVISGIKPTTSYDEITTAITEQYKAVSRNTMYNNTGSFMAVMTNGAVKIRDNRYSDEASFTSAVSGVKLVYPLNTPTPIQLSPTMVKALVGENHLSAPLDGQEITESKYRELFTWDEVEAYVNAHSGGGSGMNYSTEEQVVGTWIDSKPLYQKSISIAGVSIPTNQTVTIYTQANIKMKYFSGYLTENDITYVIPEVGVRIRQSGDNIQISSQSSASWTISEGYVTIRYTKTTD